MDVSISCPSFSSLYWLLNAFIQYRLNSELDTQSSRSGVSDSVTLEHASVLSDLDLMITESLRGKSMCSCWTDKKEFLFLTDKISQRRKPCTPDIGIDLLLCSDPDIYLLVNCKRQGPFSAERIRLSEKQCIFFCAF